LVAVRNLVAARLLPDFRGEPDHDGALMAERVIPVIRALNPGAPVADTVVPAIRWSALLREEDLGSPDARGAMLCHEAHDFVAVDPFLATCLLQRAGEHRDVAALERDASERWRRADSRTRGHDPVAETVGIVREQDREDWRTAVSAVTAAAADYSSGLPYHARLSAPSMVEAQTGIAAAAAARLAADGVIFDPDGARRHLELCRGPGPVLPTVRAEFDSLPVPPPNLLGIDFGCVLDRAVAEAAELRAPIALPALPDAAACWTAATEAVAVALRMRPDVCRRGICWR
jgi:hypothetical protein